MNKIIIKIFVSVILFFCSGCGEKTEKEITRTINDFYKNYKGNFREANDTLISNDLKSIIKKTIDFEKQSAIEIKKSQYPTDKPQLIEGEVFVGLYEGYTGFKIKEIKKTKNKVRITVILEFINSNYDKKWNDEIVLINENGWKIDDVIYLTESKHNKSLKTLLEKFIKLPLY